MERRGQVFKKSGIRGLDKTGREHEKGGESYWKRGYFCRTKDRGAGGKGKCVKGASKGGCTGG